MKKPSATAASDALKSMESPKAQAPKPPAHEHFKVTFSLFQPDVEAMQKIMDTMRREGSIFANRSDALKIAFRYAAERMRYEDMKEVYHTIKSEDGRK